MTRVEKLIFIKKNHPRLYKDILNNVPNIVNDPWNASLDDLNNYNNWVSFYCGKIENMALLKTLLI